MNGGLGYDRGNLGNVGSKFGGRGKKGKWVDGTQHEMFKNWRFGMNERSEYRRGDLGNVGSGSVYGGRGKKGKRVDDEDEINPRYKTFGNKSLGIIVSTKYNKGILEKVGLGYGGRGKKGKRVDDEDEIDSSDKTFPMNMRDEKASDVGVCGIDEVEYGPNGYDEESCDEIMSGTRKSLKSSFEGEKMRKAVMKDVSGGETKRPSTKADNVMACSHRGGERLQYVKDENDGHAMTSIQERAEQVKYGAIENDGRTRISCEQRGESMYGANEEHIGYVDKKGPSFRERLMVILRKPYSQEEYDDLMRQVSRRKLEGRGRRYGHKSLLDHHIELVRKIDLVHSDDHKVLNLLRGFAFWLMHLVEANSFPPWNDSRCLKVMPMSESPSNTAI